MKFNAQTKYYYHRSTADFYTITLEDFSYAPAWAYVFPNEYLGNDAEESAQFIVKACTEYYGLLDRINSLSEQASKDRYALREAQEKLNDLVNTILYTQIIKGVPGQTFGDTGLDMISISAGYNEILEHFQEIAKKYLPTTNQGE